MDRAGFRLEFAGAEHHAGGVSSVTSPFRLDAPLGRRAYLAWGFGLLVLKYAVDALAYFLVLGAWWNPTDYLHPVYSSRMALAPPASDLPAGFTVFLLLWGLGFACVAVALSARRARDAGLSPWWGLFLFVPLVKYPVILMLAVLPTIEVVADYPERPWKPNRIVRVAAWGSSLLAVGALLFLGMVEWGNGYGTATFLGLPFVFGVAVGYFPSRRVVRPIGETLALAGLSTLVACAGLLLFALEGVVCIAMALPIVGATVLAGALLGRGLATLGQAGTAAPLGLIVALPLSSWLDGALPERAPREVATVIEVDAPPEVVWHHVVAFSELPRPEHWLFETGVAYPLRARIEGEGVGAVRHCEFSTGAFVEPITVWDPPRRLGFDVVAQPVPMEEWSFYHDLRPPHLEDGFRSVRGEFRLIPLAGGRTRLEGSTWYVLEMAPELYWRHWSDAIIHRIHTRVLEHVARLAEAE